MGFNNVVLGNEYVSIDSAILAIMVRELIEGVMFCVTHLGAVIKNEIMTKEEKRRALRVLIPAIFNGVSLGLFVSVCVGISLVFAVGDQTNTQFGVEVGEGVSRLIGALFVTDLALKLPKWFQISRYRKATNGGDVTEVKKEIMGTRWEIGFSLFWNVLRESIEGGTLTAVAVILSKASEAALGASVGLAIAITILLSLFFGLGATYVSARIFGVLATILAQALAVGLWTGFARSFEEVYGLSTTGNEEGGSRLIYNYENTPYGDSITVLEFLGWSYSLTVLTLSVFLVAWVVLTAAQVWHNVLGKPFIPTSVSNKIRETCKRITKKH